jgi:hypothetical protein
LPFSFHRAESPTEPPTRCRKAQTVTSERNHQSRPKKGQTARCLGRYRAARSLRAAAKGWDAADRQARTIPPHHLLLDLARLIHTHHPEANGKINQRSHLASLTLNPQISRSRSRRRRRHGAHRLVPSSAGLAAGRRRRRPTAPPRGTVRSLSYQTESGSRALGARRFCCVCVSVMLWIAVGCGERGNFPLAVCLRLGLGRKMFCLGGGGGGWPRAIPMFRDRLGRQGAPSATRRTELTAWSEWLSRLGLSYIFSLSMLSNYSIGRVDSACVLVWGCVLDAVPYLLCFGCGEVDPCDPDSLLCLLVVCMLSS